MRRRDFISLLCGTTLSLQSVARAQTVKIPRIGILWHAPTAEAQEPYFSAILGGFRDLGYFDSQNIVLEYRFAAETPERFRSMAAESVALNVDVLVTAGPDCTLRKSSNNNHAGRFHGTLQPRRQRLRRQPCTPRTEHDGAVKFRSRHPRQATTISAGHATGPVPSCLACQSKQSSDAPLSRGTQAAAADLGLENHTFEARTVGELERAFNAMVEAGVQALTINADGLVFQQRTLVGKLASERRLPLGVWSRESFEGGALMSYGPDQVAMCRRAPSFVDKNPEGSETR